MGLKLNGATSGSVELDVPDAIGSDISFTLPGADGSAGQVLSTNGAGALSFVNAIEFDYWYLTADKTADGFVTSNLARNNLPGYASPIGAGMTESSGIFSFPRTGKWLVIVKGSFNINGSDSIALYTQVTTDNSNYATHSQVSEGNNGSGARAGSATSFAWVDVTDTSLVKLKFDLDSVGSGGALEGRTQWVETAFIFVRLGDT